MGVAGMAVDVGVTVASGVTGVAVGSGIVGVRVGVGVGRTFSTSNGTLIWHEHLKFVKKMTCTPPPRSSGLDAFCRS